MRERDYGPWKRITIRPQFKCVACGVQLVAWAPAFVCMKTGAYLCGPCGVKIVVHHHNEEREGVNT